MDLRHLKKQSKMNELKNNIKKLRQDKGWSQSDVSKQLGISIPAYSKIETGITDINLSRLEQISRIFEVDAAELLRKDRNTIPRIFIEAKARTCIICEKETQVIFNINFTRTNICEDCASSIFIQQASWYTKNLQLK